MRGVEAGLKDLLHVPFIDEATARVMADDGVFYKTQLSTSDDQVLDLIFVTTVRRAPGGTRAYPESPISVVGTLTLKPSSSNA